MRTFYREYSDWSAVRIVDVEFVWGLDMAHDGTTEQHCWRLTDYDLKRFVVSGRWTELT